MPETMTTSAKNEAIKRELELLGFAYTFVPEYDLSELSDENWVQVREKANYAPKDKVERYSVQMGEAPFPAIVVTSDAYGIDGRTRMAARAVRKEKFCTAFVLKESYRDATEKLRREMQALGATLNCQEGQALTAREIRSQVRNFISLEWKTEEIARRLGTKSGVVTQVRKEIAAENRLQNLGINTNGKLVGASLRALGTKEIVSMNDAPFSGLASLAADAGLNNKEILDTGKQLRTSGSDSAALNILAAYREEMKTRIRDTALTGRGRPPASRMLRQRLGWINRFAGIEHELVETSAVSQTPATVALDQAIDILKATLRLQLTRASEK